MRVMINIIITSVAVRFLSVSDTMRVKMSLIITSVAVRFLSVSDTMRVMMSMLPAEPMWEMVLKIFLKKEVGDSCQ